MPESRPRPGAPARGARSPAVVRVLERLLQRHPEHAGDPEGHLQGRGVAPLLDGDDRLARDADALGELRLRHLAVAEAQRTEDRKSTRLNSSHVKISYAVFCLKKKKQRARALVDI